jgi:Flp pilus assembly protein TadG
MLIASMRMGLGFRRLRAMLSDRRGVAAVEFAFIMPVLLCMYFITMEASQGIEVNKKISRSGSMAADLITQQPSIQKAEVVAIMKIAEAIIMPYNRSDPTLEVTAIQFSNDTTPVPTVAWSVKLDKDGKAVQVAKKGDPVPSSDPVPTKIRVANAFYIHVKSRLAYKPVIMWSPGQESMGLLSAFSNIEMGENFYLRPRISTTIPCADCP